MEILIQDCHKLIDKIDIDLQQPPGDWKALRTHLNQLLSLVWTHSASSSSSSSSSPNTKMMIHLLPIKLIWDIQQCLGRCFLRSVGNSSLNTDILKSLWKLLQMDRVHSWSFHALQNIAHQRKRRRVQDGKLHEVSGLVAFEHLKLIQSALYPSRPELRKQLKTVDFSECGNLGTISWEILVKLMAICEQGQSSDAWSTDCMLYTISYSLLYSQELGESQFVYLIQYVSQICNHVYSNYPKEFMWDSDPDKPLTVLQTAWNSSTCRFLHNIMAYAQLNKVDTLNSQNIASLVDPITELCQFFKYFLDIILTESANESRFFPAELFYESLLGLMKLVTALLLSKEACLDLDTHVGLLIQLSEMTLKKFAQRILSQHEPLNRVTNDICEKSAQIILLCYNEFHGEPKFWQTVRWRLGNLTHVSTVCLLEACKMRGASAPVVGYILRMINSFFQDDHVLEEVKRSQGSTVSCGEDMAASIMKSQFEGLCEQLEPVLLIYLETKNILPEDLECRRGKAFLQLIASLAPWRPEIFSIRILTLLCKDSIRANILQPTALGTAENQRTKIFLSILSSFHKNHSVRFLLRQNFPHLSNLVSDLLFTLSHYQDYNESQFALIVASYFGHVSAYNVDLKAMVIIFRQTRFADATFQLVDLLEKKQLKLSSESLSQIRVPLKNCFAALASVLRDRPLPHDQLLKLLEILGFLILYQNEGEKILVDWITSSIELPREKLEGLSRMYSPFLSYIEGLDFENLFGPVNVSLKDFCESRKAVSEAFRDVRLTRSDVDVGTLCDLLNCVFFAEPNGSHYWKPKKSIALAQMMKSTQDREKQLLAAFVIQFISVGCFESQTESGRTFRVLDERPKELASLTEKPDMNILLADDDNLEFQVNRTCLAHVSPVFESMLLGGQFLESQVQKIELHNADRQTFELFLALFDCPDMFSIRAALRKLSKDEDQNSLEPVLKLRNFAQSYLIDCVIDLCDMHIANLLQSKSCSTADLFSIYQYFSDDKNEDSSTTRSLVGTYTAHDISRLKEYTTRVLKEGSECRFVIMPLAIMGIGKRMQTAWKSGLIQQMNDPHLAQLVHDLLYLVFCLKY